MGVASYCTFASLIIIFPLHDKRKAGISVAPPEKINLRKNNTKIKIQVWSWICHRFPRRCEISLSSGFSLYSVSDQRQQRDATNPAKGGSDGGAPVRGYGLSQDLPAVWEYLAERCVRPCHIKCECFPLSNLITDFYGGISRRAERQSKKDGNWTFFFHSE